jgi:hypothetical protein
LLNLVVYFFAYFCSGLTLKFGDDLLDELDRPSLAWFPLGAAGVLFGLLMTLSEWDFALLTSIVLGVLLSGKVNRRQFMVGFAAILVVLLIVGLPVITNFLDWSTIVVVLFLSAVLDEKGNDWTDAGKSPRASRFFKYRLTLKLVALALVIPWALFAFTAVGLWVFYIGYEFAGFLVKTGKIRA